MACSSLFKGLSLTTSNMDIVWYSIQYASNMDLLSSVVFSLNGVLERTTSYLKFIN